MSRRCGISTVLGALLFTMAALLFIALVLRTFSESSATLTEVASVAMQNNVEERLAISISYKQVHKLTASEASASVTVRTGSGSVDASLLNALNDGRFAASNRRR
jgi:archaellum component FlaF (FlaF/FlaG flagellin family)